METRFKRGDKVLLDYRINVKDPHVGSKLEITAFMVDNETVEVTDGRVRFFVKEKQLKYIESIAIDKNWIEVPIDLIDRDLEGMGIKQEGQQAFATIRKSSICAYRLNVNKEGEIEGSVIYTIDGENWWTSLPYEQLKELIA